jgi:hypothetical protein
MFKTIVVKATSKNSKVTDVFFFDNEQQMKEFFEVNFYYEIDLAIKYNKVEAVYQNNSFKLV